MSALIVQESLGERRYEATQFPLAIGGAGSTIVLQGRPPGTEAHLGLHEEQLFIQPAEGAQVLHNGVRIERSMWLRGGDVVNFGNARLKLSRSGNPPVLEVDDGSGGNITAPPIITADPHLHGESQSEAERIEAVRFRASDASLAARRLRLNPMRAVLAVVALAAAVVLWFLFTATSISVHTEPAAAALEVRGPGPAFRFGSRVLLRPGEYLLRAQQPGYQAAQLKVNITSAPNQQFSLKLAKLAGRVRIEVPATAQVAIDGKQVGTAPGEFAVAAGGHTIAITAQRYQPFSAALEVEGAGKVQTFAPQLVPDWADVTVSSEPAGAQVLVGGEVRGVTPLTTQVMAGHHALELRLSGYKTWTTDVQVKANEPLTLGPVRLGLPDGRLVVRTQPAGASVSVAGVYRGQTPLRLELRPDIDHTVVLTLPGYEAATRQIALSSGEQQTLEVPLTGIYGEIAVRAQPADAQVHVNGKPSGPANQTLRLVATTHEIAIRKPGYVEYKTDVTPRPGVKQVVEATLLTPEQSRLAATPALIRSKADHSLKLMPLGRFTMGSPRREPGRRANEAQREVEFKRAFYLGVHEVTNAQFRRFKPEHRSGSIGQHTLDLDNQPVVGITWQEAAAYCNWLSQQEGLPAAYEKKGDSLVAVNPMTNGYRLPSDAEWEWAARYQGSGRLRRYPWGDTLPVAARSGNYADAAARLLVQDTVPDYDDGFAAAAPAGKFPPNALGLHDLGGNVAEWVHDYYTVSVDASQVLVDPLGPAEGKQHVIRDSSWKQASITDLRLTARDFADAARNDVGFRIARYAQ